MAENLTINNLENGAVMERLEAALIDVLNDIGDVNKKATTPREITCKIKFSPDKDRTMLDISFNVSAKLAANHVVTGRAFFDEDTCTAQSFNPKKENQPELLLQFPSKDGSKIKVVGGGSVD